MSMQQIVGIVALVVGIILLVAGLNASDSISDQLSNFFTGHFTDTTMWYILGGVAMGLMGLYMIISSRRGSGLDK